MKTYSNYQQLVTSGNHEILIHCDMFRFTEFYRSLGIECKINKNDAEDFKRYDNTLYEVRLSEGFYGGEEFSTMSEKFDGYSGFYSSVDFDKNGKFIKQGFWE